MHSMPCQRVNTNGYFFGSVLNLTVPTTCRSTLDSRAIAPVRNVPAGTTTCPPFASLHALIARAKAAVLSVLPSPVAPNAVTSKVRSGKMGGTIRARMAGTWSQGEAACGTARPDGVWVSARAGSTSMLAATAPPATTPPATRRSRRVCCRAIRRAPFLGPLPSPPGGRAGRGIDS